MTALPRERSEDVQLGAERAVRYLLHRVRKPYELAVAPYAQKICAATGEPNPARAFRRVIEEALPGTSYAEARLRSLILRMDFDDDLSAEEAAKESHVSRRHLQRIRSEAVRMIAYHLREIIHLDDDVPPQRAVSKPLEDLASLPVLSDVTRSAQWDERFHHEYAAFAKARERSDALEMRSIARNLRRIADESTLTLALRLHAEADLRLGRSGSALAQIDEALKIAYERKETFEYAALTLLRAEAQLFEGNAATAEELAAGALRAIPERSPEWIAGHAVVARARLTRRLQWVAPPAAETFAPDSYGGIAFAVARAQHAAAAQHWTLALDLAHSATTRAKACEFDGLLAQAAAVTAAACRACGDLEGEQRARARALRALLHAQDFLTASRFVGDSARCDDAAVDAVVERVQLLVPQTVNDDAGQSAAVRALIEELLARGFDRFRPRRLLERAAERVRKTESAFAAYCAGALTALEEMLTLSLVALAGQRCWSGQHAALRDGCRALGEIFADCRPAGLLVGYPSER